MQNDILDIVKKLLNIEGKESDGILLFYIEMTTQSVLNYCNLYELPSELKFVVARMSVESFNEAKGEDSGRVSSISEDGRTVQFSSDLIKLQIDDRVSKMRELNRFKQPYRY